MEWRTVSKKVNELIPQKVNPRKISDMQMELLKKSLKKFNLAEIPAIDTDGKILAGHQRITALKLLGRGEEMIDVRVPNRKLTEEEVKEYLIGSNKLGGEWDYELLKMFELPLLTDLGFDKIELSHAWDSLPVIKSQDFDAEAEIKKIHNPVTKVGDRIILGSHVLICGDSTDIQVVQKLMDGKQADLVNTDLPYNQNLSYDKGVGGSKSKRSYGGKVDDNLSDEDYKKFVKKVMVNAFSVSKEDLHSFFWCTDYYIWVFQTNYLELGLANKRVLTWIKDNASPTPNIAFSRITESCCYAVRGKPYLNNTINTLHEVVNENIGTGNEVHENINNLLLVKRLPSKDYSHPTIKSHRLHTGIIKRCTKVGDIILDLTAGSGSILTACEETGRVAYMCEMNPVFCDVIIKRYEMLTSKKAIYENLKWKELFRGIEKNSSYTSRLRTYWNI